MNKERSDGLSVVGSIGRKATRPTTPPYYYYYYYYCCCTQPSQPRAVDRGALILRSFVICYLRQGNYLDVMVVKWIPKSYLKVRSLGGRPDESAAIQYDFLFCYMKYPLLVLHIITAWSFIFTTLFLFWLRPTNCHDEGCGSNEVTVASVRPCPCAFCKQVVSIVFSFLSMSWRLQCIFLTTHILISVSFLCCVKERYIDSVSGGGQRVFTVTK